MFATLDQFPVAYAVNIGAARMSTFIVAARIARDGLRCASHTAGDDCHRAYDGFGQGQARAVRSTSCANRPYTYAGIGMKSQISERGQAAKTNRGEIVSPLPMFPNNIGSTELKLLLLNRPRDFRIQSFPFLHVLAPLVL